VAVVDDGLAAATRHAERAEGRNALMHASPYATTHLMDRCLGNDRRRGANRANFCPIAAVFSGLRLLGARPPQPSPAPRSKHGRGLGEGAPPNRNTPSLPPPLRKRGDWRGYNSPAEVVPIPELAERLGIYPAVSRQDRVGPETDSSERG
jgi:hypothetical protein